MERAFEAPHLIDALDEAKRYNRYLLGQALAFAGTSRTILDFGAGSGRLSKGLSQHGFDVTCVEPDAALRARIGAQGLPAVVSLEDLGKRSFDYVVSVNVLEHCTDDASVVRALRERLRPGGRCLCYVPAFRVLWTANDDRVGHQRRYARRELKALFKNAGFEVESVRYVDSLGFLAALLYRVIGRGDGEITPQSVALYDRLLFPASLALDRWLHRVGGKNLLLRAHRP